MLSRGGRGDSGPLCSTGGGGGGHSSLLGCLCQRRWSVTDELKNSPHVPLLPRPTGAQLHVEGVGRVAPSHAAFVALSQRQRTWLAAARALALGVCALLPEADGAESPSEREPAGARAHASAATDLALRMLCVVGAAGERAEVLHALRDWLPPPLEPGGRTQGPGREQRAAVHRWLCWEPPSPALRRLEQVLADFPDLRATLWLTLASLAGNAGIPQVRGACWRRHRLRALVVGGPRIPCTG